MPDRSAALRVGIIGAATIAPAAVIGPAATVPGIHITAVAARDPARARVFAAKHAIPRMFNTYRALIDDPDIDAVYIPLPNALHGAWTRRAIQSGKHVLCEKPFAANAQEAAEISSIAAESDVVVMEAFHWRYHPLAQRFIELIARAEIGTVTTSMRRCHSHFSIDTTSGGIVSSQVARCSTQAATPCTRSERSVPR